MSLVVFNFSGKRYRIVEDRVGDLVAGCQKCAFNGEDDLRCAEVDGGTTGRPRCSDANTHYEEVTNG